MNLLVKHDDYRLAMLSKREINNYSTSCVVLIRVVMSAKIGI